MKTAGCYICTSRAHGPGMRVLGSTPRTCASPTTSRPTPLRPSCQILPLGRRAVKLKTTPPSTAANTTRTLSLPAPRTPQLAPSRALATGRALSWSSASVRPHSPGRSAWRPAHDPLIPPTPGALQACESPCSTPPVDGGVGPNETVSVPHRFSAALHCTALHCTALRTVTVTDELASR